VADSDEYLLDNQQAEAGQRFDALSALFNPSTFRHVSRLGISPGWRVWEVGAGGPSVPDWLVGEVSPGGYVLATDIDTSWIDSDGAGYEILLHDVGKDPHPAGPFDLVHARLVLVHVKERERAISAMVAALRPGGWLLLEEADPALQPLVCPDESGEPQALGNRLKGAFRVLLKQRGVDLAFGRTLPRRMRDGGLVDIGSDAYFPMGGPACDELERATVEQIRTLMLDSGLATEAEIEEHLANVAAGKLDLATSPMVSAWGRRPGTAA
jgi:SAM-dependent methyltransferase